MDNPLLPYWFYLIGCVLFLVGTIIGMLQVEKQGGNLKPETGIVERVETELTK